MKIGVMSDTHGSLTYFEKALDVLSDCDVLIHGGDILYHGPRNDIPEGYNPKGLISKINSLDNIIIARGNCDADVDQMVINHPIQSPYVMSQFGETRIVIQILKKIQLIRLRVWELIYLSLAIHMLKNYILTKI